MAAELIKGTYLDGEIHHKGDDWTLVLLPTAKGIAEAKDAVAEGETMEALYDLFEDWTGADWMWIPADAIGAMTDAPIISRDMDLTDEAEFVAAAPDSIVFAHMDYAIEDPVESWAAGKPVRFVGFPLEAPVSPHKQAELDVINRHRKALGMAPLDPVAAGWQPEDVSAEAQRIRSLNPAVLRRRLLRP